MSDYETLSFSADTAPSTSPVSGTIRPPLRILSPAGGDAVESSFEAQYAHDLAQMKRELESHFQKKMADFIHEPSRELRFILVKELELPSFDGNREKFEGWLRKVDLTIQSHMAKLPATTSEEVFFALSIALEGGAATWWDALPEYTKRQDWHSLKKVLLKHFEDPSAHVRDMYAYRRMRQKQNQSIHDFVAQHSIARQKVLGRQNANPDLPEILQFIDGLTDSNLAERLLQLTLQQQDVSLEDVLEHAKRIASRMRQKKIIHQRKRNLKTTKVLTM